MLLLQDRHVSQAPPHISANKVQTNKIGLWAYLIGKELGPSLVLAQLDQVISLGHCCYSPFAVGLWLDASRHFRGSC